MVRRDGGDIHGERTFRDARRLIFALIRVARQIDRDNMMLARLAAHLDHKRVSVSRIAKHVPGGKGSARKEHGEEQKHPPEPDPT